MNIYLFSCELCDIFSSFKLIHLAPNNFSLLFKVLFFYSPFYWTIFYISENLFFVVFILL